MPKRFPEIGPISTRKLINYITNTASVTHMKKTDSLRLEDLFKAGKWPDLTLRSQDAAVFAVHESIVRNQSAFLAKYCQTSDPMAWLGHRLGNSNRRLTIESAERFSGTDRPPGRCSQSFSRLLIYRKLRVSFELQSYSA
jgi:hypothetical protein